MNLIYQQIRFIFHFVSFIYSVQFSNGLFYVIELVSYTIKSVNLFNLIVNSTILNYSQYLISIYLFTYLFIYLFM